MQAANSVLQHYTCNGQNMSQLQFDLNQKIKMHHQLSFKDSKQWFKNLANPAKSAHTGINRQHLTILSDRNTFIDCKILTGIQKLFHKQQLLFMMHSSDTPPTQNNRKRKTTVHLKILCQLRNLVWQHINVKLHIQNHNLTIKIIFFTTLDLRVILSTLKQYQADKGIKHPPKNLLSHNSQVKPPLNMLHHQGVQHKSNYVRYNC